MTDLQLGKRYFKERSRTYQFMAPDMPGFYRERILLFVPKMVDAAMYSPTTTLGFIGIFRCLFVLVLGVGLGGCAVVPETGRSQIMLVDDQQMLQLSLSEFDKMKRQTPISRDAAQTATVRNVGQRIARVAQLPNARWEFVLFDEETPNAFCMPGGKVGVHTGILPIARNEAGLATVIAHEIAHAVARHGAERVSRGLLMQMGGQVLSVALQTQGVATQQLVLAAYGVGGQVGVMLPHSRDQELEADRIGLLYMARAGYNPDEAIHFWTRFARYNNGQGGRTYAFLSTHPLDETRIEALRAMLPKARAEYRQP